MKKKLKTLQSAYSMSLTWRKVGRPTLALSALSTGDLGPKIQRQVEKLVGLVLKSPFLLKSGITALPTLSSEDSLHLNLEAYLKERKQSEEICSNTKP
jgi:hypothetical protein